jgi:hypothetical protein
MNDRYIFQKPPHRSRYAAYKRRLKAVFGLLLVVGVMGVFVYANLHTGPKNAAQTSPVINTEITGDITTYQSPYFKFQDSGDKWVLEKDRTTNSKFIYVKYHGQSLIGSIIFYVNQDTYMGAGTTRVLPVRLVNDNSFQVTSVSDPCVSQYGLNEPHLTKEIDDQGTRMYCAAGNDQYTVIVSEIGGDYHLHLKRPDGTPLLIEITYSSNEIDPSSSSLISVISSFQTI